MIKRTQHRQPHKNFLSVILILQNRGNIIKKIQRHPIRAHLLPKAESLQQNTGISFKEILTMLASSTGILAALFWLGGRFFAAGYFESMSIPLYMLTFSVGEYGEQYFVSVLLFMILLGRLFWKNIVLILTVALVFLLLTVLIGFLGSFLFKKFKIVKENATRASSKTADVLGKIFITLIFFLILLATFDFTHTFGKLNGLNYVLSNSQAITLYSKEPIGELASFSIIPGTGIPPLHKYSGLRLLTLNSGKYYLYQAVNPETCLPQEIYIVNAEQIASSTVTSIEPFDVPSCSFPKVESLFFEEAIQINPFNFRLP
jgi:hypothetical protein